MSVQDIQQELFRLRDQSYRDFQAKLIPSMDPDRMIGVRTPALRAYAKALLKEPSAEEFLQALPHRYFDEDQLHAFLLSEIRDFDRCVGEVDRFLPYVDNWATCDQLSPRCFKKHRRELLPYIRRWIDSGETYPVRFGVGMLMQHYLEEDFDPAYPRLVADLRSEEKRYEDILPYLEGDALDPWTHNKAIQKATESYRVSPEQKAHLKGLKRRER